MPKFLIKYINEQGKPESIVESFPDAHGMTAREWAEDYAYMCADKSQYEVEQLADD